ncbi:MAG: molybdenum cofactor guanylyltransferase MobA [Pseudomonadota bacterium]|nr:molybdenum cofactor guanylyltransferase MobA [Pseudomonadota bacterium]
MNLSNPERCAEPRPVSAVILAGGLARRFQGEDKGLIELSYRPLAAWVAERLSGHAVEVLINANRNLSRYAAIGHTVVPDHLPDNPGPLAGLLSAARTAQQEWLLCVPCDVPFLPLDLVMQLHDHAIASQVQLARAADETGTHFAVMLVHRELIADLDKFVREGGRQVQAWQARHASETIYFGNDPYAFLNINTPDDLKKAERIAHRYAR